MMNFIIPPWAKWAALAMMLAGMYLFGRGDGKAIKAAELDSYKTELALATVALVQAHGEVVKVTEIEYRDRIKTIYTKGDTITKEVPVYVTTADNAHCTINAGFVRVQSAAWTGEPAGPAGESDREPAGISLAQVAEADAFNATSCRAWREKAIGLEQFYQKLQVTTAIYAP